MPEYSAPITEQVLNCSPEMLPTETPACDVVILCWNSPTESDRRALEIVQFLGANVQYATLESEDFTGAPIQDMFPRCSCVITHVETLANIAHVTTTNNLPRSLQTADHVLVHGFRSQERHSALLRTLSFGKLEITQPGPNNAQIRVTAEHPEWCFQFSGLLVGTANPVYDQCFKERCTQDTQALVFIGEYPFFVRFQNGTSQIFLLAGEFSDLDERVQRDCRILNYFSRLVPLMMFLRGALGARVWRNDYPRACFIIDDTLLKKRHGFLKYDALLESIRRYGFSTCIAFIPWNYRRTSREVAGLFSAEGSSAFLCVHGCDHTQREFECTDALVLHNKARLALKRMEQHRQLSGVPFDPIMVFPQGLFSAEALPALRESGYLAAINTEQCPSTVPDGLSLRDLLDVAVTRFGNFPVFGRRYPKDLADFAFDLFLGKPVLAVEHHRYFREGCQALEAFVAALKKLDSGIEWTSPALICSRACLRRTLHNGNQQLRFYTNCFQLRNDTGRKQAYELLCALASDSRTPSVTVNGIPQNCECGNGNLKVRLSLAAGESATVRVMDYAAGRVDSETSRTLAHNVAVGIRRLLCEVRDNYLDASSLLRNPSRARGDRAQPDWTR